MTLRLDDATSVVHLAGVNRGDDDLSRATVNAAAGAIAHGDACRRTGATPHVIYSSTTKRDDDTPYGRGKREGGANGSSPAWAERDGRGGGHDARHPQRVWRRLPAVLQLGGRDLLPPARSARRPTVHKTDARSRVVVGRRPLADRVARPRARAAHRARGSHRSQLRRPTGSMLRVSPSCSRLLDAFRDAYFDRDVVPNLTSRFPWRASLYSTFLSHVDLEDHRPPPPRPRRRPRRPLRGRQDRWPAARSSSRPRSPASPAATTTTRARSSGSVSSAAKRPSACGGSATSEVTSSFTCRATAPSSFRSRCCTRTRSRTSGDTSCSRFSGATSCSTPTTPTRTTRTCSL